ncbi:hypothetical protein BT96DRAFT_831981, partial [Gymnopus androsaceus JB14]
MSTNIKHHVPPLKEDLSNWVTYKKRVTVAVTSHGLDYFYLTGNATPLKDDEYDKLMEALDKYETKEAQLCDILFQTISTSLFLRIKDEATAYHVWKELCSIVEDKSPISVDSLHNKMMNLRTPEEGDIRETLTQLQVWYEELAGMGYKVPEDSYMTYIRQSYALAAAQITHNGEVIDTGASRHFSPILSNFKNLVRIAPSPVTAADGHSFIATARGD